jgi:hypothetical protein
MEGAVLYKAKNERWIAEVQKNIDILNNTPNVNYQLIKLNVPIDKVQWQYIGLSLHYIDPPIYDYNLPGFVQRYNMSVFDFIDRFNLWDLKAKTEARHLEYKEALERIAPPALDKPYYFTEYIKDPEYAPAVGFIYPLPVRYDNIEPIIKVIKPDVLQGVPAISKPLYVYGPGDEFEEKYGLPPKPKKKGWFDF